jgi:hypothetical protein
MSAAFEKTRMAAPKAFWEATKVLLGTLSS